MLVQTASVNVDCRKAEWFECYISCVIGCHTPARVVKEDEESRSEPHGTPKHNSELCSRIAHYSTARNRHFWRDTTDNRLRGVLPFYRQSVAANLQADPKPTATQNSTAVTTWKRANENIFSILFFTTRRSVSNVVKKHLGKTREDGVGNGQAAWSALEEKYNSDI